MAPGLNQQQALVILYDLAQTIGSELHIKPLLTRTLQRFMYHTGFPVGLLFSNLEAAEEGRVSACLELAIGDYALARRQGESAQWPEAILCGPAWQAEIPEALAPLPTRKPQRVVLRLPVENYGVILLLEQEAPDTSLSLPDLFQPVLAQLSTTLTLCQAYAQEVQRKVEQEAYYNPHTGLPNGVLFMNTLRQAVERARQNHAWLAVVQLNVDDFRRFNEELGETGGDDILLALARTMGQQLLPGEMLAHLSGDEFALLLPELHGWEDVDERIVRILQSSSTPLEWEGRNIELSFSAGISVLPADAEDADTLARHAAQAMNQAKQESRGSFRLFDVEQNRRTVVRRQLLKRLEQALAHGEFRLFYQPKVDMPSGRVMGFEALLRWFPPDRPMVPPGEFLPMVENTPFVVPLGEWVMREALTQAVAWSKQGLETCISVNISGRHLQMPDFGDRVRQALADVEGAKASQLEIEILETSVFENYGQIRRAMDECAELGILFALDDFGTGYSSLAYLHQLPATTIKIDQMFVRNLFQQQQDIAIIRAVVQIARVFGRDLVAEGVEEPEHATLLASMGCRCGQGYGIGRPMPAEAVLPWFRSYHPLPQWRHAATVQWHPALYELLRLCCKHRQWRRDLDQGQGSDADTVWPPVFEHCELSETRGLPGDGRLWRQAQEQQERLEALLAQLRACRDEPDARDQVLKTLVTASTQLGASLDALFLSLPASGD